MDMDMAIAAMSAETSSVEEALAVVESLDPNLGNNLDITA